ncbi:hypothetical protein M011DRAFT_63176 [Sporormia fimetaria CBS 119925]|uniref:Uncharacterized protein n=1 Tax=Sporormia fimetaria CBS 119925 TaxID=1340428 RepID=A0A6A6VD49_9PLEO|nr:hypothetical protein M011DRAFT_63176 [Sporormia fimetaria CBS 119925]
MSKASQEQGQDPRTSALTRIRRGQARHETGVFAEPVIVTRGRHLDCDRTSLFASNLPVQRRVSLWFFSQTAPPGCHTVFPSSQQSRCHFYKNGAERSRRTSTLTISRNHQHRRFSQSAGPGALPHPSLPVSHPQPKNNCNRHSTRLQASPATPRLDRFHRRRRSTCDGGVHSLLTPPPLFCFCFCFPVPPCQ